MTSLPPNKKDDSTESFLQRGMNKELLNCCFERYYLSVVGVIIGNYLFFIYYYYYFLIIKLKNNNFHFRYNCRYKKEVSNSTWFLWYCW